MKRTNENRFNAAVWVILPLASLAASCSEEAGANEAREAIISTRVVSVAAARHAPLSREHRFSGVVRAADRANLTFTLSGRVVSRAAEIGATVKAGEVLAVLDRRPLRNALAGARARKSTLEARLAQARRDGKRAERLREAKAIGTEELEKTLAGRDTLEAQYKAASAEVAEASRLLGEATLRAPFSGTVIDVLVEPGEFAQAGRPAILLSGERKAEVEVEVPDSLRQSIAIGDVAEVRFPLTNTQPVTGTLAQLGRASAGAGQLLPVVIAVPDGVSVVAGQTAEVVLRSREQAVLSVPVAAVVDPSGARPAVFRVTDGVASLVSVELGKVVSDRVVVRLGLSRGDEVVVAGHANLVSGETVELARPRSGVEQ